MLAFTRIDNRPVLKYTTWLTSFLFFINIMCYSMLAYSTTPLSVTEQKISIGDIINSIMGLLVSEAEAAESGVNGGSRDIRTHTGSFYYSYPIQVPPGRGGLTPSLSLNYSSASGNGWVGIGWNLALSSIERDTSLGAPNYNDNDPFIINMDGTSLKLVKDGSEYRLKDEGAFLRLIKSSDDTWVVTDRDGTKYYYGENSNCWLNPGSGIFRWYIARIVDRKGNTISFAYTHDPANNQVYPSQINYNAYYRVEFKLETRTDVTPVFDTYFEVRTAKRLKSILIYYSTITPVRAYKLTYNYSSGSYRSILTGIQQYGGNFTVDQWGTITGGAALPSTSIVWSSTDAANWFGSAPLITGVNSPLGATTTTAYASYSAGLPFTLQTVSSITTTDNQSHSATQSYTYQNGFYDPVEQVFRGFGKVIEENSATGFVTTKQYDTSAIYQGCVTQLDIKTSTDIMVSRIANTWNNVSYGSGRFFVYINPKVDEKYDEYGYLLFSKSTQYSPDNYGNIVTEYEQTSDGINCFTRTEYSNDITNWIIGKPVKIRIGTSDPETSPALRETEMTYNTYGLLQNQKLIHWEGSTKNVYTTSYSYDNYGNIQTITEPNNKTTTISYDSNGMFSQVTTNPVGHKIHRTYDYRFGQILTETGPYTGTTPPSALTTTFTYDVFGRQTTIVPPAGPTKTFSYNVAANNNYTIIYTSGNPTVTLYSDNFGRQVKEKTTGGAQTIYRDTTYDNAGRVTGESLPYSSGETIYWKNYEYDPLRGYLKKQINPGDPGERTFKTMSQEGCIEKITDENGNIRKITRDSLGRIVKIEEPMVTGESAGGETFYTYDIFDNLLTTKDPLGTLGNLGNIIYITYDDLGRKKTMDDPYMGYWQYFYDANNNLIRQIDGENRETTFTYDNINRIVQKNFLDDNRIVSYTYDQARSGYFNVGALTTLSSPEATYQINYDRIGRKVNEKRIIGGAQYLIDTGYNSAGRLSYIKYPDAERMQIDYIYNNMGHLDQVKHHSAGYVYADFEYTTQGQVDYVNYWNGVKTDYTYYSGSFRLHNTTTSKGANTLQSIQYTFDDVGNVSAMDVSTTPTVGGPTYNVNHSFVYDQLNRLKTAIATCANDASRRYNQGYNYDLAGNMTSKTGLGAFEVTAWDSDGFDRPRIRPETVEYDSGMTGIGERDISYNQENKPTEITFNGGTTTYLTYDGAGNRIKKVKGSDTVIYVGDIYEIRNGQATFHIFANGKKIVSMGPGGSGSYVTHSDQLGSTSIVTAAYGKVVEEIGYLPFGATLFKNNYNGSTWESDYRFNGQEFDEEYQLYNYNARLYDPVMCRFISPDTIVPHPYNPQSLNRYAYVLNNPLRYSDPSGHGDEDDDDEEGEWDGNVWVMEPVVCTASRLYWFDILGYSGWMTLEQYYYYSSLFSGIQRNPPAGGGGGGGGTSAAKKVEPGKGRTSKKGVELLIEMEGKVLGFDGKHIPYTDQVGHATIGYGHEYRKAPALLYDIYFWWGGLTEVQARELLSLDLS